MFWKLALVEELLPGRDGIVKAAQVKIVNAEQNCRIFTRSVKHLVLLELNANSQTKLPVESEQEVCIPPAANDNDSPTLFDSQECHMALLRDYHNFPRVPYGTLKVLPL